MNIGALIILLVGFAIVAYLAYWVIASFIPEPAKTPVLAIVGVMLLLFLLSQFWPGAAQYHLWR